MTWNILTDRLIRVRFADGSPGTLTLPEVYEALYARRIENFTVLRPHQRHAWHALLALLGAIACIRAGLREPPADAATWERILRALTPEFPDDDPWSLVSPPERPAFLQPVIGAPWDLKAIETPDALDMLVTSRNHDLKSARMVHAQPDDWLFALMTLQTMEGFLGAGNFGISRMNGGFANRPGVGLAPPGGVGAHVMRDIRRLIELQDDLLDHFGEYDANGPALLWLMPWDGATALSSKGLHPHYVEICRRIRLTEAQGVISARAGNSKAGRVAGLREGGVTGDPWTPLQTGIDGSKALTIDLRGFHYRRLADIITGKGYVRAPLQEFGPGEDGEGWQLVCRALARGQGKTEQYHERRVAIPAPAIDFLRAGDGYRRLAGIAEGRLTNAASARSALRQALMTLFQNGPKQSDYNPRDPSSGRRADPFLTRFDGQIDADFFERAFEEFVEPESDRASAKRRDWLLDLLGRARSLLSEAQTTSPVSSVRRHRAAVRAEEALARAFYRAKDLKDFLAGDVHVA